MAASCRFLLVAACASFLMLLAPRPFVFPEDGAYLRALADVHDFCPADFDRLCGAGLEEQVPVTRRLATLFMEVAVVDPEEGDHAPSRKRAPLRLGGREDFCLRSNYADLSAECASAIALVDDAAAAPKHHVCPFMLGLSILAFGLFVVLARKIRAKKAVAKAIFEVLRGDTQLRALVEAKAGVSVPEPCNCQCGKKLLGAFLVALALSLLVGAPTVVVSSLLAAGVSGCVRGCRRCCAAKVEAAEDVEAAPAKTPDTLLQAAKADAAKDLKKPLL